MDTNQPNAMIETELSRDLGLTSTLAIGLTLLNIKGTKESGRFQIIVTAAKVVLLIWFVYGGIRFVNMEEVMAKFSTDMVMIGSTAAMVFITFFGFSAIAASAGEVKNPVKTIPRAIFISMGVVELLQLNSLTINSRILQHKPYGYVIKLPRYSR